FVVGWGFFLGGVGCVVLWFCGSVFGGFFCLFGVCWVGVLVVLLCGLVVLWVWVWGFCVGGLFWGGGGFCGWMFGWGCWWWLFCWFCGVWWLVCGVGFLLVVFGGAVWVCWGWFGFWGCGVCLLWGGVGFGGFGVVGG
ncbi:hypothetical protein RA267_27685, partial [Pseudomonas syringae pv. tagetis]|uniref:hypothetical protein n=1 Tax=Pseudomonas syringae group genomosp. 7 TaxID=251699 RepID=UPI00376F891F